MHADQMEALKPWARKWTAHVSEQFLSAYFETVKDAPFIPQDPEDLRLMLDVYFMDRAVAEINNDLATRPDWVGIPLSALKDLASRTKRANPSLALFEAG
jgi:maltose alpha-D-glucosyltransferase / alpha-amylase